MHGEGEGLSADYHTQKKKEKKKNVDVKKR